MSSTRRTTSHHRELLSVRQTNGGGAGGHVTHWWTVVECIDLWSRGSQVSGLYTPSEGEQSDGVINNTAITTTTTAAIITMTDREDKVYKAKLAEQAERYDGET